jgi:transcriptional regulator with XRE-family HTH domain
MGQTSGRSRVGRASPSVDGGSDVDVGLCLRARRRERRLSLRVLAEQSGVSVNTLSLIENGKVSPSVSTLQRIAQTLQVPITALFDSEARRSDRVVMRADRRPKAALLQGVLEDLGVGMAQRTLEAFVLSLDPGAESGPSAMVHGGQEFVFCLEGRIDYVVEGEPVTLEEGDSLLFDAHLSHRWLNHGSKRSRTLMVLCPFDSRDRPGLSHFPLAVARAGTGRKATKPDREVS